MRAARTNTPLRALVGGSFETSPKRQNGEVSKAPLRMQVAQTSRISETGTGVAINYLTIGVAAHVPKGAQRGGSRNSGQRKSVELTAAQIANLVAAEGHSRAIGLPFTRMITIHWEAAGIAPSHMVRATGRFLDLLTKALGRHGYNTALLWTLENGPNKGAHCHLLAHIPMSFISVLTRLQKGWLRRITGKPYRKRVIVSRPIGGRLGLEIANPTLHSENLATSFAYICKAASQTVLNIYGLQRSHEPGGLIIGKRCGTSQNISAKARRKQD